MTMISQIQILLGVEGDDIWGPKSQAALNKAIADTEDHSAVLTKIQKLLSVKPDGIWGPISQGALNNLLRSEFPWFEATASSFADPADVKAFKRCKETGKSDQACFRVGDNGVGQFGKITAQEQIPMVAIHKDDMISKWGSINGAAHRMVRVSVGNKTVEAAVEDRLGVAGRIDLNPSAAKELGLEPPFLVKCSWSWV